MIAVNEPLITETEIQNVMECLQTGWISSAGHFIEDFEKGWAKYCGMESGIAVANGSLALSAAMACLGLEPGDEVVLPSFTIASCANAVIEAGLKPVLVDCDPHTWCMDVTQVEAKLTQRTRAIMPIHIYGHPVDMDPLIELAKKHNLVIVEDAAEAHGAEYKGRKCGGIGQVSCFSFYANKIVTTGEGGMILTSDPVIAERLCGHRNLCFRPPRRFYHTEMGHNYRLTNLQAAIGLAQMQRIEEHINQKRWMAKAYQARLADLSMVQLPVERSWAKNVYWMYGLVLAEDIGYDAAEFARRLAAEGVETRPFFLGMHEQPVYHDLGLFVGEHYPVTELIARQGLYLPSGLTLTEGQLEQVCVAVRKVLL